MHGGDRTPRFSSSSRVSPFPLSGGPASHAQKDVESDPPAHALDGRKGVPLAAGRGELAATSLGPEGRCEEQRQVPGLGSNGSDLGSGRRGGE